MHRFFYFAAVFLAVLIFLYIPELFPLCSCCKRKKFRPFIKIHKAVGISPGYSGCRSVCRKCCTRYDLKDLDDLDRLIKVRHKLRLERLSRGLSYFHPDEHM